MISFPTFSVSARARERVELAGDLTKLVCLSDGNARLTEGFAISGGFSI